MGTVIDKNLVITKIRAAQAQGNCLSAQAMLEDDKNPSDWIRVFSEAAQDLEMGVSIIKDSPSNEIGDLLVFLGSLTCAFNDSAGKPAIVIVDMTPVTEVSPTDAANSMAAARYIEELAQAYPETIYVQIVEGSSSMPLLMYCLNPKNKHPSNPIRPV